MPHYPHPLLPSIASLSLRGVRCRLQSQSSPLLSLSPSLFAHTRRVFLCLLNRHGDSTPLATWLCCIAFFFLWPFAPSVFFAVALPLRRLRRERPARQEESNCAKRVCRSAAAVRVDSSTYSGETPSTCCVALCCAALCSSERRVAGESVTAIAAFACSAVAPRQAAKRGKRLGVASDGEPTDTAENTAGLTESEAYLSGPISRALAKATLHRQRGAHTANAALMDERARHTSHSHDTNISQRKRLTTCGTACASRGRQAGHSDWEGTIGMCRAETASRHT